MIEFDCDEVKRQLNRLAEALPDDRVDIWIVFEPAGGCGLRYTAYVNPRGNLGSVCDNGKDVVLCVDNVIKEAGDRRSKGIRLKREAIEKARQELAKLESELDPLVLAIDKSQADSEIKT